MKFLGQLKNLSQHRNFLGWPRNTLGGQKVWADLEIPRRPVEILGRRGGAYRQPDSRTAGQPDRPADSWTAGQRSRAFIGHFWLLKCSLVLPLSCLVLSCFCLVFVLSCLCLVMACLVLSCPVLACLGLGWLPFPGPTCPPNPPKSHLFLSCLVLACLGSFFPAPTWPSGTINVMVIPKEKLCFSKTLRLINYLKNK